jgi:RNA polymerase sigma-70 factor (ECF subfamily)
VRRYLSNQEDRESVINLAFIKLVKNLSLYEFKGEFDVWSFVIIKNILIDEFRKSKAYNQTHVLTEDPVDVMVEDSLYQKFSGDDLEQMILNLPGTTRLVFNLFAIEGYSYREISEELEIPEGTCKWYVSEARRRLKAQLSKPTQTRQ